MDLLYLLGSGSKHDNVEIKYSLRSIEKFCKGYDRVFLVGQKPEWITNVEYYYCDDPYDCTHKNMMHKILFACHNTDISEDFVMQGDDHFYVKPYDFNDIKPYEKGELPTKFKEREVAPKYRTSLIDTRKWLISHGYPYMNGSQHCGMPFKKSLFLAIEDELLKPAFKFPYGLESSSIMAAALNKHCGIPYEHWQDRKVKDFTSEEHLKERIGERFCFSIYDGAFRNGIEEILQRWFPDKSKYEK